MNQTLINSCATAVIFRPFFAAYMVYLKLSGGSAIMPRLDESNNWDINISELETLLKSHKGKKPKYMLITNPNNPTGTVLSEKSLGEAVEMAKDNGIFIVSDEVYDELLFPGTDFTSVGKLAKGIPHMILSGAS